MKGRRQSLYVVTSAAAPRIWLPGVQPGCVSTFYPIQGDHASRIDQPGSRSKEGEQMACELVQVPFHGDVIEATQDPKGKVWIPLKRPCEALGLQAHGQAEKLKSKAWAVTQMICATGPDGKSYEMLALDLDSLPIWLATIDSNRVKPEIRPKLEVYQREAKRVLAEHFLGRQGQPAAATLTIDPNQMAAMVTAIATKFLTDHFANCKPATDYFTVDERCREREWGATPKERRRVRDVAIGIYRERLGEFPLKNSWRINGEYLFERKHLSIVDRAIDIVRDVLVSKNATPLFVRQ